MACTRRIHGRYIVTIDGSRAQLLGVREARSIDLVRRVYAFLLKGSRRTPIGVP